VCLDGFRRKLLLSRDFHVPNSTDSHYGCYLRSTVNVNHGSDCFTISEFSVKPERRELPKNGILSSFCVPVVPLAAFMVNVEVWSVLITMFLIVAEGLAVGVTFAAVNKTPSATFESARWVSFRCVCCHVGPLTPLQIIAIVVPLGVARCRCMRTRSIDYDEKHRIISRKSAQRSYVIDYEVRTRWAHFYVSSLYFSK
jgi:hypothetical protein